MSSNIPLISSRKCIKALEKVGFLIDRQQGSHIVVVRDEPSPAITISIPERREIPRGTLRNIIRTARLTVDEFKALLD